MIRRSADRRCAAALQEALERYERALASGTDPALARAEIAAELGGQTNVFVLATGLSTRAAPIPDPKFAAIFAQRLRHVQAPSRRVRRPRFSLTPVGLAASVIAAAAVLLPSLTALPGDALYAVKGASEDARVWLATGRSEARIRIDLADERLEEVEALIARSRLQAIGVGTVAAGVVEGITDPELSRLIESTLHEAGKQLEAAAKILTRDPAPDGDLDALVKVSRRGQKLAANVADELPTPSKPPFFRTAVKLAKVEAVAKAARTEKKTEPTPEPCLEATPSPTPSPTPTLEPSPEAEDESGAESTSPPAEETPSGTEADAPENATSTATPLETPCATQDPTPSPSPSPTPTETATSSPSSTPTSDESMSSSEDGHQDGMFRSDGETSGGEPHDAADA